MRFSPLAASFIGGLSVSLMASGHYARSIHYASASRSILLFSGNPALPLHLLFSRGFLRRYEAFLTDERHCRRNTVSFYTRTLRSIYNQAVKSKRLSPVAGLFDEAFTGSAPTVKRAVSAGVVARILTGDLSGTPRLEECRDLFLLSLYLQGMTFIDLAHLRKSSLQGDRIAYRRSKTGSPVEVVVLPEARAIFDKYAHRVKDSPYLLPLITRVGEAGRRQYESARHRQNRQLKDLAARLGITENLTTYVARHTWATLAYHGGTEVGVVSQGMGHHGEEVTRAYLAAFGRDRIEQANHVVLSAILSPIVSGEVAGVSAPRKKAIARRAKEVSGHLRADEDKSSASWRIQKRWKKTERFSSSGKAGRMTDRRREAPWGDSGRGY